MNTRQKDNVITVLKVLACILVITAAALPAVYMNTLAGYLPVLMLLTALLISSLAGLYMRSRVRIDGSFCDMRCIRGADMKVGLTLTNESPVSCPRVTARLTVEDVSGGSSPVRKPDFPLAAGETVDLGVAMKLSHVGIYSVGLESVELYDLFGLTRGRLPVPGRFNALVMPRIRPVEELNISQDSPGEALQETRVAMVGGIDYSGVREYELGDPMKQIHWKLSAHTRNYMTRLQENNLRREYLIILDFAANGGYDRETLLEINDCLIETALSLAEEIYRHDISYTMLFCDRDGMVRRTVPLDRDGDADLLRTFSPITPEPSGDYPDAAAILAEEHAAGGRAGDILIVTSRTTPDLLEGILEMRQQRRMPELFMVVPSNIRAHKRAALTAPLSRLDDGSVPYYIIGTEEREAAV